MESQSTACDGASAGYIGMSTHDNASPREKAVLSTKLSFPPVGINIPPGNQVPASSQNKRISFTLP